MSDHLTDSKSRCFCDIGESDLSKLTGDQKRDLERLLSECYLEPAKRHPESAFKLTAKGMQFLGERGAGLNEA